MLNLAILVFLSYCINLISAVQNVKVQGADFVNNVTNSRFQILGLAYASFPSPIALLKLIDA